MPEGTPIHIGSFSYTIHFYGIVIMLGTIAGCYLAGAEAKRRGHVSTVLILPNGLILSLGRRFSDRLKRGDLFLIYVLTYGIGRFLLDFLRLDASRVLGINFNQTIMGFLVVLMSATIIWRHRSQPISGSVGQV